jgi:hypothetical protein
VKLVSKLNVERQTEEFFQVILTTDYVMFEKREKFRVIEEVIHGNV